MSLKEQFGKDVLLTGWGHSRFGKLTDETLESLIVQVATEAIANAGIEPGQIDEIYLGQFNSGMMPLAFPSSLALQVSEQLANVPATRVENACASGSAAFQQGTKSLLAGTAKTVLVIGAEKMTHAGAAVVGAALLGADYDIAGKASTTGFTGLFAEVAKHYEKRYGPVSDVLGTIAAKNHRNGVDNPYAQLRKDLGEEFCRTVSDKNPMVADPLRRTDCSPVSDGAAAVVLSVAPTGAPPRPSGSPVSARPTTSSPPRAATPPPSPRRGPPGSARWGWPASGWRTWTSPKCMTASPSPNCSCTRPWD
jgi:acetyl-CoA C-acetyltransferase